jgi:hypothetical protein
MFFKMMRIVLASGAGHYFFNRHHFKYLAEIPPISLRDTISRSVDLLLFWQNTNRLFIHLSEIGWLPETLYCVGKWFVGETIHGIERCIAVGLSGQNTNRLFLQRSEIGRLDGK